MLRPGSLLSRTLAVLLLLLALSAGYRFVVQPVIAGYAEAARSIADSRALLQRYQALVAQAPLLEKNLAEQERRAESQDAAYLQGSEVMAAAALQDYVREVITRAGGELQTTQMLPSDPEEEQTLARRAGVRLQFGVGTDSLHRILHELETGEPYLFVREITIREQRTRRRRNDGEPEPRLDVSLEVYGYARGEA